MLATIPEKTVPSGYGELLLTSLLALLLVCVLAWVVLRFGFRWLKSSRAYARMVPEDGPIRVLARASLDQQHGLHVVAAGGKTLLLATGEGGVNLLTELDGDAVARDLAVPPNVQRRSFHEFLLAALGRSGPPDDHDEDWSPESDVDTRFESELTGSTRNPPS